MSYYFTKKLEKAKSKEVRVYSIANKKGFKPGHVLDQYLTLILKNY